MPSEPCVQNRTQVLHFVSCLLLYSACTVCINRTCKCTTGHANIQQDVLTFSTIMLALLTALPNLPLKLAACEKVLCMQVLTVFFGSFIAGSLLNQLNAIIHDPTTLVDILGEAAPQVAVFFMTYLLLMVGFHWQKPPLCMLSYLCICRLN